jgi:hypothetical protein
MHSVQLDPLNILFGSLSMNYELLLYKRHGIGLGGSYLYSTIQNNKGYGAGLNYRYHLHRDMNSNFIGLFLKKSHLESSVSDGNRGGAQYDYSVNSYSMGANYGYRNRLFKTKLNYVFRIGAGVPISTFQWKNKKPESLGGLRTSTFEKIAKYSVALDGELTVGYSF